MIPLSGPNVRIRGPNCDCIVPAAERGEGRDESATLSQRGTGEYLPLFLMWGGGILLFVTGGWGIGTIRPGDFTTVHF
jgi:hypothetical protein